MRRLCLFSGGLALAAALYVYAAHAAPWPLLLGLAVDMAHHALDPRLKNASTDLQEVL